MCFLSVDNQQSLYDPESYRNKRVVIGSLVDTDFLGGRRLFRHYCIDSLICPSSEVRRMSYYKEPHFGLQLCVPIYPAPTAIEWSPHRGLGYPVLTRETNNDGCAEREGCSRVARCKMPYIPSAIGTLVFPNCQNSVLQDDACTIVLPGSPGFPVVWQSLL